MTTKIHGDTGIEFPDASEQSVAPASGENPNGKFIKNPDGSLICYRRLTFPVVPLNGAASLEWTFPHAFHNTPDCFVHINSMNDSGSQGQLGKLLSNGVYVTAGTPGISMVINCYGYNYAITATANIYVQAMGRWKA